MTNLTIGQQVINFGERATVIDFHRITGDPLLYAPGIGKWYADPAKCEPVPGPVMHKDGLIVFY